MRWLPSRACGDPARRITLRRLPADRASVCLLPGTGSRNCRATSRLLCAVRTLRNPATAARVLLHPAGEGETCHLRILYLISVGGLFSGLRLRDLFRLRLLGFAQTLDALPDAGDSSLGALKALHGRDASQAVKNRDQSLRRPRFGQFHQFLLAGEGIERGCGCGGALLGGAMRRDVVVGIDCKRHFESPWCRALRGHHIHHSEAPESKGVFEINRPGRRNGDEVLGRGPRWVHRVQMVGHGTKFGRKKEQAITALLSHRSMEEAARAAGIGVNTLLRWMKEPEFDQAYRKARREAFGQGTARLQQASGAAVSSILKIMLDQHAPASTKLRAADLVLSHGAKAIEIEDIEARVAELERAAEEAKKTR